MVTIKGNVGFVGVVRLEGNGVIDATSGDTHIKGATSLGLDGEVSGVVIDGGLEITGKGDIVGVFSKKEVSHED